jgi:hypothetical protein
MLPLALWSGQTVESTFGAGDDLWTAEATLEKAGWVPPLDVPCLVFTEPQSFLQRERGGANETKTFRA